MATGNLEITVLDSWHRAHASKFQDFGGFEMPTEYSASGILREHGATRTAAGLFDISHMSRFFVYPSSDTFGVEVIAFLQRVLTNNVSALDKLHMAQYAFLSDEHGFPIDDAYLYRIENHGYMLVVNAGGRETKLDYLINHASDFPHVGLIDLTKDVSMFSLQGPKSANVMNDLLRLDGYSGHLPEPRRNRSSDIKLDGVEFVVATTGYAGEPKGFELFPPSQLAVKLWGQILGIGEKYGLMPVGLGARDTLRMEAGLPLGGHEFGVHDDGKGKQIDIGTPILAIPAARSAVSFAPEKGNYVGRAALLAQARELRERELWQHDFRFPLEKRVLPKVIMPFAVMNDTLTGPGSRPARQGFEVWHEGKLVGHVTSGTSVPSWQFDGQSVTSKLTDAKVQRPIGMMQIDADMFPYVPGGTAPVLKLKDPSRGVELTAIPVSENMRSLSPHVHAVIHPEVQRYTPQLDSQDFPLLIHCLVDSAAANTRHRQFDAINLIPSENTPSPLVRALSGMDPAGRYAEHRRMKALGLDSRDALFYQGADFALSVEEQLQTALGHYMNASQIDVRPISGQQSNQIVFEALKWWKNRKLIQGTEPANLHAVFSNSLIHGGHLSSQLFGLLRNVVAIDPVLGRSGVHELPATRDDPYRIDVTAALELIDCYKPEMVVFGRSMFLYREPIREFADALKDVPNRPIIMADYAHAMGLIGQHFQNPLLEGADIVTGSLHKSFPGTQRGVIAASITPASYYQPLWEAVVSRTFPGSMSNHHLGTLLGQLGATYEMLHFKDAYQLKVIENAKAFARALADNNVHVEGDPLIGYTETHQVVIRVPNGPETALRLELSNIIVNSQALPDDYGFTDARGIRMGVQEMTRFGMKPKHFVELAGYVADAINGKAVAAEVSSFRKQFTTMEYVFQDMNRMVDVLHNAWKK